MNKMIDLIKEAYVNVMGIEKWNSLTDEQKHDAIMTIAVDFNKSLDKALEKIF